MAHDIYFSAWQDAGDGEFEREVIVHSDDAASIVGRVLALPDGRAEMTFFHGDVWGLWPSVVAAEAEATRLAKEMMR